ncbi:hypothetical protein GCM10018955_19280 [Planomonospora venezuelensis]
MDGNGGLLEALRRLRRHLDRDLFPFAVGDAGADRRALRELTGQLDDYLIPRLSAIDAPLLAVVGGSTGAGKSTLVNSLVGADVTEPGVLRPTTLAPTLVTSPADRTWFTAQHVLPGLPRVTGGPGGSGGAGEPGTLRVVVAGTLPPGLALLDAPDIDSVVAANRELAAQLLAAADLWLFTTTASRYADEVPWSFLRAARERSTALAVILSRVPPEAMGVVAGDLARLLEANGLGGTRLFEVAELPLPEENARLPRAAVGPVADWLAGIAADVQARDDVVRQTLSGALESLATRVPALADAVDRQRAGAEELRAAVAAAYAAGLASFDEGMLDGSLLRGEVLARWQDFIGTGDLMRSLESRVGWLRDRVVSLFTGRPAPDSELRVALEHGVEALVRAAADGSAERALESWSALPAGRALLEEAGAVEAGRLGRASPGLRPAAEAAVRGWQGYVLDLVRQEGAEKRTTARIASFGVNGAGLLLMIAVFASTGGTDRDRGRHRRGHQRAQPEAAGGRLRRPGGPHPDRPGPRGPARPGRGRPEGRGRPLHRPARRGPASGGDRPCPARRGAGRTGAPERAPGRERPAPRSGRRTPAGERGRAVKLLRRRGAVSLDDRLAALEEAADLADGRLEAAAVAGARAVVSRAGARRSLSVDHTVAALAGATGSGKSSLFNLLSGTALATVGVTRPTTSTAQAALWEGAGSGPLLDWLEIPNRHEVDGTAGGGPEGAEGMAGLVLLDLPDHDSIELAHRLEVDRLARLVDLLVWVLDPQKYADAAVHDRYLAPLARHRDVTVVVLNQIDRLSPEAAERCLADLRRLLDADGLTGVPVLGVSARTGAGVAELRALLESRVADRRSWADRLAADAGAAADLLARASAGAGAGDSGDRAGAPRAAEPVKAPETSADALAGPLTSALSQAAGVPLVVAAVAKAHRHRSVAATGWPVTRWIRRFRPDPLRRLRLGAASAPEGDAVGRTSIPAATTVQRSQTDTAVRDAAAAASAGLPEPWAAAVRHAARSRADELEDGLDRAVATTSLGASRRPVWWRVAGAAQWLVLAATAAGALWLLGLFAMDYLRLPEPPVPTAGEAPWPTVLLLGGVLTGIVLALLSRAVAWLGGRRRARKAARALRASVEQVARALVLEPVTEELSRHRRFTEAVSEARDEVRPGRG